LRAVHSFLSILRAVSDFEHLEIYGFCVIYSFLHFVMHYRAEVINMELRDDDRGRIEAPLAVGTKTDSMLSGHKNPTSPLHSMLTLSQHRYEK